MNIDNLQFITPEILIVIVALAVLVFDLVLRGSRALIYIFTVGLLITLGVLIVLWLGLDCKATYFAMPWMQCNDNSLLSVNSKYLVVDKFNLLIKFILIGTTIIVGIISNEYFGKAFKLKGEYYSLLLFSLLGMMVLVSSTEMITMYVALELSTLPLIALSAITRSEKGLEASLKFIVLSAVSSAFLLYGLVMLYGITGTTDLTNINNALNLGSSNNLTLLAIILVITGLGFKVTAVPFHMWSPDVYQGSPMPVTIFLSIASKIAAIALALRLLHDSLVSLSDDWVKVVVVLAVASMTLGNLVAINQNNVKRLLAYSSIAHSGYIMIGLAFLPKGSEVVATGASAVIFYLIGYALMNLVAFSIIYLVKEKAGNYDMKSFSGFGFVSPVLGICLVITLISLIGLPPSVGFMGKFYLFSVALENGMIWLVVAGVVNSVISSYYYLKIVKTIYSSKEQLVSGTIATKRSISIIAIISSVGILILGIFPSYFIRLAEDVVKVLLPPVL